MSSAVSVVTLRKGICPTLCVCDSMGVAMETNEGMKRRRLAIRSCPLRQLLIYLGYVTLNRVAMAMAFADKTTGIKLYSLQRILYL